MASQVIRPGVPYQGAVPNGLHEGKMIEIKGSVPYGAELFEVNLVTGFDAYSDKPLHISVRFDGRSVVRNSFERNQWGYEERHGMFPFSSGREFTMMILVDPDAYRISVNSQHCWEFNHRIPIHRVSAISITGSVMIDRIEFIEKVSPYQPGMLPTTAVCPSAIDPGFMPGFPTVTFPTIPGQGIGTCIIPPPEQQFRPQTGYIPTGQSNLSPVYNPSIPYAYPIYGGLKPGMMVYISGRPSASAYKFTINLQRGTSPYPPPDIAFHFDIRFFNHTVVRNSRTNNVWEREENLISHFPFQQGVNFDMIIRVDSDRYMVALNGQHFLEYRHRLHPLDSFDTLYIENDIVVSSIRFS